VPVHPRLCLRTRSHALATLRLLALVPVLALVSGEALAGRRPAAPPPESAPPGIAWTSGEAENATCQRTRRKLWQPGEGWVVRNVTVCR